MHFSCLNLFLASLASSRGQKKREASDKFKQLKCISIICSFFCWLPSRCSSVGWRAKQGKRVKIRKTRSEDRHLRRQPLRQFRTCRWKRTKNAFANFSRR